MMTTKGLTEDFDSDFPENIVFFISFAVLLFDHCLTFLNEVEYIWKKKKTPFSNLFLLSRYFALLSLAVYISLYLTSWGCRSNIILWSYSAVSGPTHCGDASPLVFAFSLVTTLTAEATAALRAYAMYQNNKFVLLVLSSLSTIHCFLLIWVYTRPHGGRPSPYPLNGQAPELAFGLTEGLLFAAPTIIFEIVVGLMIAEMYRQSRLYWDQMPLMRLVASDGLVYSGIVIVSNVIWITVHIYSCIIKPVPFLNFTSMAVWSGCITTTMVGRLTLNIRMYNPIAQDEPTFPTVGLGSQISVYTPNSRSNVRRRNRRL